MLPFFTFISHFYTYHITCDKFVKIEWEIIIYYKS
mgnify:CR=1 FL=1